MRRVIDARLSDSLMRKAPKVNLASAEALAQFTVELQSHVKTMPDARYSVTFAMGDVDNCFRRLKLDQSLEEYFVFHEEVAPSF